MDDKENQFCQNDVKEFRNENGALQNKKHIKIKHDAYEYTYKQRVDSQESNIKSPKTFSKFDVNKAQIHLSFFNPSAVQFNNDIMNHLESNSNESTLNLKSGEVFEQSSFFTNLDNQDSLKSQNQNWPIYQGSVPISTSGKSQYLLIKGYELTQLLKTIQSQSEEIVRIKRQNQQLHKSTFQSKVMEESKFPSVHQLNRNASQQAQRQQLTLLQKLKRPFQ